jgi:hypothetical protein
MFIKEKYKISVEIFGDGGYLILEADNIIFSDQIIFESKN